MARKVPLWQRNLAMLWISQLLVMAGFSAMAPFVSLFMKEDLHIIDEKELALNVSLFAFFGTLGYAIFCPIWGKLSDWFGTKPMLLRGTFVTAFLFPMMGYVSGPGWLQFLRFLTAACAGTTAASQIMIARNTPDERQGFAQGVLSTAIWGGAMLGNVFGGLIIHYFSYLAAFWFCGILYFLGGFAILFTREDFTPEMRAARKQARPHRYSPGWWPALSMPVFCMIVLSLVNGVIRGIDGPFVALKVEQMTSAESAAYWTGIISAVICGFSILAGILTGYLADLLPPKKFVVPLLVISAVTMWLQGFTTSLLVFLVARTALSCVAGGISPVVQKVLSQVSPKRKRGASFGFASLGGNIGAMIAAGLGGWSMAVFQLNSVFYVGAILFLLSIPVFSRLLDVALTPYRMPGVHHRRSGLRHH